MKKLGETIVGDYMTQQTVVINKRARLTEAIRLMDGQKISAVPVIDEQDELVGILTNRELLQMSHEIHTDLHGVNREKDNTLEFLRQILMDQGDGKFVSDVMTSPVPTVTPETNMITAATKLNELRLHHLPVIANEGQVVGVLSSSDFVRAITETGALIV